MASKKYNVLWTEIAQNDLIEILEYIASDSLDNADKIFLIIKNESAKLENYPERGRLVPELEIHSIYNYRELIISPWRIVYRIDQKTVFIYAVIDGRRSFEDIIFKRLMRN